MPNIFDASKDSQKKHGHPHRHVDDYSEVMRAEIPFSGFFSSFMPKPISVKFDNQDKRENIILVLRQHPATQIQKLLIVLLLSLAPFLMNSVGVFSFLPGNYQFATFVLWFLLVSGFSLEVFLTWFFSVYIITDERVIDVDFLSLIYKDISSAKIDKIEDVKAVTGGAFQSIMNYGTVSMQTAGAKVELQFENIPQPAKVTKLLNELILEEEQEKIEGRVY